MNKLFVFTLILLTSLYGLGQNTAKKSEFSIDLSFGKTIEFSPIRTNSRVENGGTHFGMGGTYMFNPFIGVKGVGAYDRFKVETILTNDEVFISHARQLRGSLMAVIDLGELIGFSTTGTVFQKNNGFTLRTILGGGFNSLNNQEYIDEFYTNYEHAYVPDGDRLVHAIVGLNPKYYVSKNLSINLEFNYIYNFFYHRSLDWTLRYDDNRRGVMFNGTIGLSYRF